MTFVNDNHTRRRIVTGADCENLMESAVEMLIEKGDAFGNPWRSILAPVFALVGEQNEALIVYGVAEKARYHLADRASCLNRLASPESKRIPAPDRPEAWQIALRLMHNCADSARDRRIADARANREAQPSA